MHPAFVLRIVKRLVKEDHFTLVNRRSNHAKAVSKSVAKIVIDQLDESDFVKREEDRKFLGEYLWIYETEFGIKYYIKFKFSSDLSWVKFISFHEAMY